MNAKRAYRIVQEEMDAFGLCLPKEAFGYYPYKRIKIRWARLGSGVFLSFDVYGVPKEMPDEVFREAVVHVLSNILCCPHRFSDDYMRWMEDYKARISEEEEE